MDALAAALLAEIDSRGGDATGMVAQWDDGSLVVSKAATNARGFSAERPKLDGSARTVLLHTRMATQGSPAWPENNHPVESGGVWCVHNGHVWNDDDVLRGVPRRGRVDSEALPASVARVGWENALDADGLGACEGQVAVAMLDEKRPGELLLARGFTSPLYFLDRPKVLVWASTEEAIRKAWRSVYGSLPADGFWYLREESALRVGPAGMSVVRWKSARPSYARGWSGGYLGRSAETAQVGLAAPGGDGLADVVEADAETYDAETYDADGYDRWGYDRDGFNRDGAHWSEDIDGDDVPLSVCDACRCTVDGYDVVQAWGMTLCMECFTWADGEEADIVRGVRADVERDNEAPEPVKAKGKVKGKRAARSRGKATGKAGK